MRQKKCDSLKQQKKVGRTDKFSLYVIGVLKVKSLLWAAAAAAAAAVQWSLSLFTSQPKAIFVLSLITEDDLKRASKGGVLLGFLSDLQKVSGPIPRSV